MKTLQKLFAGESRWTQGTYARDKKGKRVFLDNKQAACFCLLGGLYKVYVAELERQEVYEKLRVAAKKLYGNSNLPYINDMLGLEAVRAICKEANV